MIVERRVICQFTDIETGHAQDPDQRVLFLELLAVEQVTQFLVEIGKVFAYFAALGEVWAEVRRLRLRAILSWLAWCTTALLHFLVESDDLCL